MGKLFEGVDVSFDTPKSATPAITIEPYRPKSSKKKHTTKEEI
jgi:hypothetical protein